MMNSWDELKLSTEPTQPSPEMRRLLTAYVAVAGSEEGKLVLEDLRKRTIEQPCAPAVAVDGAAFNALMGIREGENNLYRYIISMIKRGQTRP